MSDPREAGLAAIEAYCASRVSEERREEVRVECSRRGNSITILESRPPWNPDFAQEWSSVKVAQLRFDPGQGLWSIFSPDSNGRWHPYDLFKPSASVDLALIEIERDPTGIFWG